MFLFHSSSFSTSLTFTLFSKDLPQQSLRTGTHCNLLLKHKDNRVPQAFFEDCLHLHCINYRRFSGAASKSVFTGSKPSSVVFHPHSNGFEQLTSNSFHCATCKWMRRAWKKIAVSIGGIFKDEDVVTASMNLAYLSDVRLSSDFLPQLK